MGTVTGMVDLVAGGIFRRHLTYFVRVHIPRDRWDDLGRVYKSATGQKRDHVRTLSTTDRREALRRRDQAIAAIRQELDDRLRLHGLQPLSGDWTAEWGERAELRRRQLAAASNVPDPMDPDDEGETDRTRVRDTISEEAQELHETRGGEVADAYWATATGTGLTVQAAADKWLATLEISKKNRLQTIAGHRSALALLASFLSTEKGLPALSAVGLPMISRRIAAEFVEWRQQTKSGKTGRPVAVATIQRELSSYNGLWRWALRGDHAALNPWADQSAGLPSRRAARPGAEEEEGKRAYSEAELVALLRATGEDWAPNGGSYGATLWDLLRLGLLTGCRANELGSLRVSDFVPEDKLWGGGTITIRAGKTASAKRTLPLHPIAQRVLAERLAQLPDTAPGASLFPEVPAQGPDGRRGKMLTTRFLPNMRRVLKAAGIEPVAGEVDLHSLRRSFAQHVRNAMQEGGGVDGTILGALMGHSETTLALKLYARNTLPPHLRQAVDAMGETGMPVEVRRVLEETAGSRPRMTRFSPARRNGEEG